MGALYFEWTAERVAQLKQWWNDDGLSASVIAAKFGEGLTRSAVIGKITRDGLSTREATFRQVRAVKPNARRRKPTMPSVRGALALKAVDEPEEDYSEPEPVNPKRRTDIFMLSDRTCRWPMGDPQDDGFHFCGSHPIDGSVYCGFHHRKAYQPEPARQYQNRLAERRALSR